MTTLHEAVRKAKALVSGENAASWRSLRGDLRGIVYSAGHGLSNLREGEGPASGGWTLFDESLVIMPATPPWFTMHHNAVLVGRFRDPDGLNELLAGLDLGAGP